MPAHPAITVLMPVYNRESFVGPAIESILKQTFTNFELLIINDGSSDQSRQVIMSYQDPRIRFLENPDNLGTIATLNRGLRHARGHYVTIMDSDDLSLPQRLQEQYLFMESNPRLAACGVSAELFSDKPMDDKWLVSNDPERLKVDLVFNLVMPHGGFMFRRSLQRQFGITYDPSCPHAEDYDFIYKLSKAGELGAIEKTLYRYRRHGDQTTVVHRVAQTKASNSIRARILEEIGVKFTNEELALHQDLALGNWAELAQQPGEVERWLVKLYRHLTTDGNYRREKVSQALWNYWALLCLAMPPHKALPCLARTFHRPLSSVFPLQSMLAPKMLLYYIYKQVSPS